MDSWEPLLNGWQNHMRASSFTLGTVTMRRAHVAHAARSIGRAPADVQMVDLVEWLAVQRWAPNTRRAYRASLRSFFAWCHQSGHLKSNPALSLPPVSVPRGRPRPTPETDYREAIANADPRARLAILLAGQCGLRRGELAVVTREDVELEPAGHYVLRVKGKGGHVRLVPLPVDLADELLARPGGWVFPSNQGGHLTPHHLGKIVSRNLAGALATHSLRHRCASVAYSATKDIRAVQELLGHAKIETTILYTKVPDDSIRAAMEAAAR